MCLGQRWVGHVEFSDSAVKLGRQDEIAASKSRALTWHWKGKSRPAGSCTSCTRLLGQSTVISGEEFWALQLNRKCFPWRQPTDFEFWPCHLPGVWLWARVMLTGACAQGLAETVTGHTWHPSTPPGTVRKVVSRAMWAFLFCGSGPRSIQGPSLPRPTSGDSSGVKQ